MPLTVQQRNRLDYEYYNRGYMLGRDALTAHMRATYGNAAFPLRKDIAGWLKQQKTDQVFQYQNKPKIVSSFVPKKPLDSLSIDLIDYINRPGMMNRKVYKYILVIIDNFSRYMWCYKMQDKLVSTIAPIMQQFLTMIQTTYNKLPKYIQSDQGGEFGGPYVAVLQNMNPPVKPSWTIPGLPQSNSLVERANGVIKRILAKLLYIHNGMRGRPSYFNWPLFLDQAVEVYNNRKSFATGMTPAEGFALATPAGIAQLITNVDKQKIADHTNQPDPYQVGSIVRLRISKGKLDKFSDPNWSDDLYYITQVIQRRKPNRPDRYRISKIGGNTDPRTARTSWVRESLLVLAVPDASGKRPAEPEFSDQHKPIDKAILEHRKANPSEYTDKEKREREEFQRTYYTRALEENLQEEEEQEKLDAQAETVAKLRTKRAPVGSKKKKTTATEATGLSGQAQPVENLKTRGSSSYYSDILVDEPFTDDEGKKWKITDVSYDNKEREYVVGYVPERIKRGMSEQDKSGYDSSLVEVLGWMGKARVKKLGLSTNLKYWEAQQLADAV